MNLIKHFVVSFLLVTSTQVFAEKMLVPPSGQSPECNQSYENAAQPKTSNSVMAAMEPICQKRGGIRVLHKVLTAVNISEPTGIILSCLGDNPNVRVFSCVFATSYEDI